MISSGFQLAWHGGMGCWYVYRYFLTHVLTTPPVLLGCTLLLVHFSSQLSGPSLLKMNILLFPSFVLDITSVEVWGLSDRQSLSVTVDGQPFLIYLELRGFQKIGFQCLNQDGRPNMMSDQNCKRKNQ